MGSNNYGILPYQMIKQFAWDGLISSDVGIDPNDIQASALDVTLKGGFSWHLINPGETLDLPLNERLNLPSDIHVSSSSKSTYGKLAVMTQILDEGGNEISPGYKGELIARIHSRNFKGCIYPNTSLAHIRFSNAPLKDCMLDANKYVIDAARATIRDGKLIMHFIFDLAGDDRYVSKKSEKVLYLDPTQTNPKDDFFKDLPACEELNCKAGKLYLYWTEESLRVKRGKYSYVCEMPKMDPTGQLRVNGARFIEWPAWPGRIAVELMPDRDMVLKNHREGCEIVFYRLLDTPERKYSPDNGNINNLRLMSSMIKMY